MTLSFSGGIFSQPLTKVLKATHLGELCPLINDL